MGSVKAYRPIHSRLYIKTESKYIRISASMFNMVVDIVEYDPIKERDLSYDIKVFFDDHNIDDYKYKIIQGIFKREVSW